MRLQTAHLHQTLADINKVFVDEVSVPGAQPFDDVDKATQLGPVETALGLGGGRAPVEPEAANLFNALRCLWPIIN